MPAVGSGNKDMGKTAGEYAADMLKEKYGASCIIKNVDVEN